MRTAQLLLFFLLAWCQTTESLTDKCVNLGENVTLDCQIDVKEIYWVFQKLTDSPVLILRTFTAEYTSSHVQDQRLKDKYSALTRSRLFISNITVHELGIYYCAKLNKTLQISNGTRLHTNESAQDQKQTEGKHQEQPCLLMLKLKKPRKSQQPRNVEPEQTEDLNTAEYSEIELPTYSRRENPIQINGTYVLLQKSKLHPRSTQAEIITS
ncbi:uncharacterized protein LOC131531175 isoform X2 [Onychostoma macrolepis]|uniref:uncharacterized protein LOC131531175 isoform X2 n=1 Tax=Onychostoma macrolepis TaxID=369639 RepID=UPI00272DA427|nr:uncharacterized protein LOC131531175 isoform X2 [Onychostoma macrolepis]